MVKNGGEKGKTNENGKSDPMENEVIRAKSHGAAEIFGSSA